MKESEKNEKRQKLEHCLRILQQKRNHFMASNVQKALDELKRQLGEKVIDVEPDRVELLEADQDGAIQH